MTPSTALRLGRVSNLPTVWSNVLAGTVLAGADPWTARTLLAAVAVSLLYVGGMYLNDAFDRDFDARERPGRPIPAGLADINTVFAAGFALLLAGIAVLAAAAAPESGARPAMASVALAGAIVYYDWHHKQNALSPVYMGLCRALVYVAAGYAAAAVLPWQLLAAAAAMLAYLVGLTYSAKQERLDRLERLWPLAFLVAPLVYALALVPASVPSLLLLAALGASILLALHLLRRRAKGDVPRAVVGLIAGIALVDALFMALAGAPAAAAAGVACWLATLAAQRWIAGT
jgi:4-hydroxybenzoate polyprenyltransferase